MSLMSGSIFFLGKLVYYKSLTPPTVDYNVSVTNIKRYKVLYDHLTFWRTIIHL